MRNGLAAWMAELVIEAQQTHFEASKVKIKQYTHRRDSRLKKLKREIVSTVTESFVLTDHLKELLASLGYGANMGGHVETEITDEAEVKFLGADDCAADVPENVKQDVANPRCGQLAHIEKCFVVT